MQDAEFRFYKHNRKKFLRLYENKYLLISGEKLLGIYDSHVTAYNDAILTLEVGAFIIRHPEHGEQ